MNKNLSMCELQGGNSRQYEPDQQTTPYPGRFAQRYFICDQFWSGTGPIFIYLGSQADVTL